jgi:hypothetical protein
MSNEDAKRKEERERELTVKIAQLNARLQVDLAWTFGLYAASIALWVFGYQFLKENESVSELSWGLGIFFIVLAIVWIIKTKRCVKEFEKLK